MDMAGEITLLFRTSTGSQFGIHVNRSDTILQIKRKIERRQGIPIFYQRLNIPDHVRLGDTTITHLTLLDLEVVRPEPLIDLFIRPSRGDAFFISFQPRNVNIRQIKEKIQQITGIPVASQTLGCNLVYLPNHLNFKDSGIRDYYILDLIIDWDMMLPLEGYNLSWQPQHYQPGTPLFRPQPSQPSQQRPQHQSGPQSAHQRSQRPQHHSGSQFAHQRSQWRQHQAGPELAHPRRQRPQHQSGRRTNSHQEMDSRVHQPPPQAIETAASGSGNQILGSDEIPDDSVIGDDHPPPATESESGFGKKK